MKKYQLIYVDGNTETMNGTLDVSSSTYFIFITEDNRRAFISWAQVRAIIEL